MMSILLVLLEPHTIWNDTAPYNPWACWQPKKRQRLLVVTVITLEFGLVLLPLYARSR